MNSGKNNPKINSLVDKGSARVLIIGCILISLVMLLMSISSIQIINQAVVTKLKTRDLVNLAQSCGAVIEGKIDRAVDASLLLSYNPDVSAWVESNETDGHAEQNVKSSMTSLVQNLGYTSSFLAITRTNHYWSYTGNQFNRVETISINNADDAWLFHTVDTQRRYSININSSADLKNAYVWINVLVGDLKQPLAVTGVGMDLNSVIETLIQQNKANKMDTNIWLVNRDGIVQLATNKTDMEHNVGSLLPSPLSGSIMGNVSSAQFQIGEYKNTHGQLYDIAYKQIRNTYWKLVIQIPRSETTGFLTPVTWNILLFGMGILFIVLFVFFVLSNKLANPYKRAVQLNYQLEQTVALRTAQLQEKTQSIQDGIDYARSIQQSIFPTENEMRTLFPVHFILFEPKETVGGDFYWCKPVATGRLFIVGDCTGHGMPGALLTTAVTAMLNQITEQIFEDPAHILVELHRRIHEFAHYQRKSQLIFAGVDIAVFYFANTGDICYAGANIPAYVWNGQSLTKLTSSRLSIDSITRSTPTRFENQVVTPAASSTIYVTTDGFWGQSGGSKGFPFGKKRWEKLLTQVANCSMEKQKQVVWQTLLDYQGQEPRKDDITVIGFKL